MKRVNTHTEIGEVVSLFYIAGEQHPYLSWYRMTNESISSRTAIIRIIDEQLLERVSSDLATGDEVELLYTSQDQGMILLDFRMLKSLPGRELKILFWPLRMESVEEARIYWKR